MDREKHHAELIRGISEQLKPILDKSEQAVYIYLDDTHKVCNKRYASLLGYSSIDDWAAIEAPLADVIDADQQKVIAAYQKASEMLAATSLDIALKNVITRDVIKMRMIVAPMLYQGHVFTVHFLARI